MRRALQLVSLGLPLALSATAWANIPRPRYWPVSRCVRIENVSEFPDIVVIQYVGVAPGSLHRVHVIDRDACVPKGTKFNDYYFLWAPRPYVDSVGVPNLPVDAFIQSLSKQTAATPADAGQLHLLRADISPANSVEYGYGSRESEELVYRLRKSKSGVTIRLARKTSRFSDGKAKTEIYGDAPAVVR